eukprot:6492359-Amphidinium_carterae.1
MEHSSVTASKAHDTHDHVHAKLKATCPPSDQSIRRQGIRVRVTFRQCQFHTHELLSRCILKHGDLRTMSTRTRTLNGGVGTDKGRNGGGGLGGRLLPSLNTAQGAKDSHCHGASLKEDPRRSASLCALQARCSAKPNLERVVDCLS